MVSGTALDTLLVRRLQDGDEGGHMRRAMAAFPLAHVSAGILQDWFLPHGRKPGEPYRLLPMQKHLDSNKREQCTTLAAFVEVWLAKQGHQNPVGINLLTKIQVPNLACLYGAMLAGIDVVIMGAGIPREVPGVLDAFAAGQAARLRMEVSGEEPGESTYMQFDPQTVMEKTAAPLARPLFLPIVSAHSLAATLARKSNGRIDGFVVETQRRWTQRPAPRDGFKPETSEPVYGTRDEVDLNKIAGLGLPFWLAGGTGSPEAMAQAVAAGAHGIQVGTLFAYCDESGLDPVHKTRVLQAIAEDRASVRTDGRISPTGFPFKVVEIDGEEETAADRTRQCDLGYLRSAYRKPDGNVGYRCSAEPISTYSKKGGSEAQTVGRGCLCNGLMANVGMPQIRKDAGSSEMQPERALITSGDDLASVKHVMHGSTSYSAQDVIRFLTG